MKRLLETAALFILILVINSGAHPQEKALHAAGREGIISTPKQPGTDNGLTLSWSPDARMILVQQEGKYIKIPGFLVSRQMELASAYFLYDPAAGSMLPVCRAKQCRWLPDGTILSYMHAPFDTHADRIREISDNTVKGPQVRHAHLSSNGKLISNSIPFQSGYASVNLIRYIHQKKPYGRNNYRCFRLIDIREKDGTSVSVSPPVKERQGMIVGFNAVHWHTDSIFRASVVDMDAGKARTAPPGMYLNVTPVWYEYDLDHKEWKKLKGEEIREARAQRISVAGGVLYIMRNTIKWVKGSTVRKVQLPELVHAQISFYDNAVVSADARYCVFRVRKKQTGPLYGRKGGNRLGVPAPSGQSGNSPDCGWYFADLVKGFYKKLSFPGEKSDPDREDFASVSLLEDGCIAFIQYTGTTVTRKRRGTVSREHKGGSYLLNPVTGVLEKFRFEGFDWDTFMAERVSRGKNCAALLVRKGRGNPARQSFHVIVARSKSKAWKLTPPRGFNVGYLSGLYWSPDGRILAVTESKGIRVWITRAQYHSAAVLPGSEEQGSIF